MQFLHWWNFAGSLTQGRGLSIQCPEVVMFTAAFFVGRSTPTARLQAAGIWNPDEARVSINLWFRDLLFWGLEEFQQLLQG